MPFCTNCGAQVPDESAFCSNCGAPSGQAAPPPPPPVNEAPPPYQAAPAYPAPPQQFAQPPAKKGPNLWLWIGGGLAALFLLVILGMVGVGFFVAKKAHDAGFDTALMQKNPVLGAARMALALNPEVEVIKMNEETGELTIREKKSGKVLTMRAEDVKNGKISFTDETTGEELTVGGGAAKLPGWVPNYPGSNPEGTVAARGGKTEGGMVHFKTNDSPAQVLKFYQDQFTSAGYKITSTATGADGGILAGEDEENNRSITATVGRSGSETQVSIAYSSKN
ncbi:MAG: zinc-ribbon domain-containing protein [Acidobacteria bacterium]|nr:zinc-ribbon domain-containing protein [Acidobacteriota bacterium]